MILYWQKRKSKKGENIIREFISNIGYHLISKFSETDIPKNVGEFRLISKRIRDQINMLEEKDFFLRGINSFIGYKYKIIEFDREKRQRGTTKYNKYTGSLKIGLNGIFSFSTETIALYNNKLCFKFCIFFNHISNLYYFNKLKIFFLNINFLLSQLFFKSLL